MNDHSKHTDKKMPAHKLFDENQALEQAMFVFWQHGYEGTSMQMLVDAMNIKRGSLYNTFNNKEALFLKSLKHYNEFYRKKTLNALIASGTPAIEIIKLWLNRAGKCDLKKGIRGCFLVNTSMDQAPHNKVVATVIGKTGVEMTQLFAELLEQAKLEGSVKLDLDSIVVGQSLFTTLTGLFVLARGGAKESFLDNVICDAVNRLTLKQE